MSNVTGRDGRAAGAGRWRSWQRGAGVLSVGVTLALGSTGCSLDGLLNSDELPANVNDPAVTDTPFGAQAVYKGALVQFQRALGGGDHSVVAAGGLLSDELMFHNAASTNIQGNLDQRLLSEGGNAIRTTYSNLQQIRGQAGQARGLLVRHLSDQPDLAGHLYAIQGYAEVFLAELYCSGIPLSTLDFEGDFTYQPGSSTAEVLAHAVALFDTALTMVGDSTRFLHLAQTGRARALLGLGDYTVATASAAAIPNDYTYTMQYTDVVPSDSSAAATNFAYALDQNNRVRWSYTVPNLEGSNGMDWRTSEDPRTQTREVTYVDGLQTRTFYHPSKYDVTGASPIVLASGVEARLIEAEAALQAGSPTWLTILNELRTDGTFEVDTQYVVDTTVTPPDTTDTTYDTLWHAGSGGYDGLAPLADPGTMDERVDLLFRERAFWLFLTGHRQGDLRRLIRQYGRLESEVYPVGTYPNGFPYGSDVTIPIPATEFLNPLYTGCASRGA